MSVPTAFRSSGRAAISVQVRAGGCMRCTGHLGDPALDRTASVAVSLSSSSCPRSTPIGARCFASDVSSSPAGASAASTSSNVDASSARPAGIPPSTPRRSRRKTAQLASRPGADLVGPPHPISNIRPLLLTGSAFEEDSSSAGGVNYGATAASSSQSESDLITRDANAQHGATRKAAVPHPYSLSEFNSEGTASSPARYPTSSSSFARSNPGALSWLSPSMWYKPTGPSAYYLDLLSRLEAAELRHRLHRARAEALTQRFWADNNLRFEAAQDAFELEMQIADKVNRATMPRSEPGPASDTIASSDGEDKHIRRAARHLASANANAKSQDDKLTPFYSSWLSANAARHRAYNSLLWQHTIRDLAPAAMYQTLKMWARMVRRWERLLGRL